MDHLTEELLLRILMPSAPQGRFRKHSASNLLPDCQHHHVLVEASCLRLRANRNLEKGVEPYDPAESASRLTTAQGSIKRPPDQSFTKRIEQRTAQLSVFS